MITNLFLQNFTKSVVVSFEKYLKNFIGKDSIIRINPQNSANLIIIVVINLFQQNFIEMNVIVTIKIFIIINFHKLGPFIVNCITVVIRSTITIILIVLKIIIL